MITKALYIQLCKDEDILRDKKKEMDEIWNNIQQLKKQYENHTEKETKKVVRDFVKSFDFGPSFPDTYSPDLTWKEKTYLAVKKAKLGDTTHIAKTLMTLEEGLTFEKAKQVVTLYASKLFRKKYIGARDLGDRYEYFFIEKVEPTQEVV